MTKILYTIDRQSGVGMPLVDLKLSKGPKGLTVSALVDSGASLNILPMDVGLELGLVWEEQNYVIDLGGMLQGVQAYGVVLEAQIGDSPPTHLAFAWVNRPSSQIRTLLGQVNFFQEYDVYFYGSEQAFEIKPKSA
ncbi:MAG: hypothetical protein KDE51_05110 [Anaerolineales bacterium]|nr:hypothetical protein [Anaerolineales bacterium]